MLFKQRLYSDAFSWIVQSMRFGKEVVFKLPENCQRSVLSKDLAEPFETLHVTLGAVSVLFKKAVSSTFCSDWSCQHLLAARICWIYWRCDTIGILLMYTIDAFVFIWILRWIWSPGPGGSVGVPTCWSSTSWAGSMGAEVHTEGTLTQSGGGAIIIIQMKTTVILYSYIVIYTYTIFI